MGPILSRTAHKKAFGAIGWRLNAFISLVQFWRRESSEALGNFAIHMLDPISIINVISFALQCSDLLLRGFRILKEKGEVVEEYEVRVTEYKGRLDNCKRSIVAWCKVWGFPEDDWEAPPRFPKPTLEIFWTPAGYSQIKTQLSHIKEFHVKKVKEHLEGRELGLESEERRGLSTIFKRRKKKEPPTKQEWEDWRKLTAQEDTLKDDTFYEIHRSLLGKVCFALFRNEELSKKLDRLEKSIEVLDEHTRIYFNDLRGKDIHEPVRKVEVDQVYDSVQAVTKFTTFATKMYEIGSREGGKWSLELRTPGEKDNSASQLTASHLINLDFTIHVHKTAAGTELRDPGCRRVRVRYSPEDDLDELNKQLPDSIDRWLKLQWSEEEKDKIESLRGCQRLSRPIRDLFLDQTFKRREMAEAWLNDQARLLVAFTNWMVLLLNTPWTDHACCCQIRFEQRFDNDIQYVLSTLSGSEEPCHSTLSKSQKVRVLGLVLAEIVLMRPLQFSLEDTVTLSGNSSTTELGYRPSWAPGKTFQQMVPSENGREWKEISRQSLLNEIKNRTMQEVRDAIEFCFRSELPSSGDNVRGEITEAIRKEVLTPLLVYFRVISEVRRRYSGTTLGRQIDAKYIWPPAESYDSVEDCRLQGMAIAVSQELDDGLTANALLRGNLSPALQGVQFAGLASSLGPFLEPRVYLLVFFLAVILAPANIIILYRVAY